MPAIKRIFKKATLMGVANILALAAMGLAIQIGGAYLVNAAVICFPDSAPVMEYAKYMGTVRSFESREIMYAIFVAPLIEEIVFRLLFLRAGNMVLPFWAANLIQAALFGIYHTLTLQRIYAFVMGLMIGCVFHYCPLIYKNTHTDDAGVPNSLIGVALTFILHVVINFSGLYVAPLFSPYIDVSVQFLVGSACMLAAFFACIRLLVQSKRPKEQI